MTTREGEHPPRTVYHDFECNLVYRLSKIREDGRYTFTFMPTFLYNGFTIRRSSKQIYLDIELPTIPYYYVKTQTSEITVMAEETVAFSCHGTGSPRPSLFVKGQRSNTVVEMQDVLESGNVIKSFGTKKMFCNDTDIYTCTANNGRLATKSISVFVQCVPQLTPFFDQHYKEYYTENGMDLNILIRIISYPEPKKYVLTRTTNENKDRSEVNGEIVDLNAYSLNYIPDQPPTGTVILMMFEVASKDTGQYVLTIDNGIEEGMNYTFDVALVSDIPTIPQFSVNEEKSQLVVPVNETVDFLCRGVGNPMPVLSVKGKRSNEAVQLTSDFNGLHDKQSVGTKYMSCKDTDVYTCTADNGDGGVVNKSVSVFVQCLPELAPSSDQHVKEYKMKNGIVENIQIPIICYPEPYAYVLTHVTEQERIGVRTYSASYLPGGVAPEGSVILRMFGLTSRDAGKYELTIDNGIENGFKYSFDIETASASDSEDNGLGVVEDVLVWICLAVGVVLLCGIICLVRMKVKKRNGKETTANIQSHQEEQQQQQRQLQLQQQHQTLQKQHRTHSGTPIEDYDMLNPNDILFHDLGGSVGYSRLLLNNTGKGKAPPLTTTTTTDVPLPSRGVDGKDKRDVKDKSHDDYLEPLEFPNKSIHSMSAKENWHLVKKLKDDKHASTQIVSKSPNQKRQQRPPYYNENRLASKSNGHSGDNSMSSAIHVSNDQVPPQGVYILKDNHDDYLEPVIVESPNHNSNSAVSERDIVQFHPKLENNNQSTTQHVPKQGQQQTRRNSKGTRKDDFKKAGNDDAKESGEVDNVSKGYLNVLQSGIGSQNNYGTSTSIPSAENEADELGQKYEDDDGHIYYEPIQEEEQE